MTLTLYYHPLASFCHKVLIALYENGTPFTSHVVDLMNRDARADFLEIWPAGKIPVLRDKARRRTVPETSIIIEYLDQHYSGPLPLLPQDTTRRLDARLWDRFFDFYVEIPVQKIVTDRLRAEDEHDPRGVADAMAALKTAYAMVEQQIINKDWAVGETFSIADCAAAPALFYANIVAPFSHAYPNVAAYFERLVARPSFSRVIAEARPYFELFPFKDSIPARFLS